MFYRLQQADSRFSTGFYGFMIPDAGLDFADVGAAHHEHAEAGLADTATDGQGQFVVQEHLMERQFPSVVAA